MFIICHVFCSVVVTSPKHTLMATLIGEVHSNFGQRNSVCRLLRIFIAQNINRLGGKKGNRTEPNRTNGLYRTEPKKISDCCGTGFYLRHRTEPNECDIYWLFYHYFFSVY